MSKIQIPPEHLTIVKKILGAHIKKVFVFGSRAKGTAKPLSDLDLAIMESINVGDLIRIKENFENSNLPFKVDIIEWDKIDDSFKSNIKADLKPVV